jgi:hypothetical protein
MAWANSVNGAQVCVIANKNTVAYGDVNQVHFGLGELYNCGPTTIYCDCCAISKTKIGTEPAS